MMHRLAVAASLWLVLGSIATPAGVAAQDASGAREARQRLTRGIARYEEAMRSTDPGARRRLLDEALAEIQAAYAASPRPLLLFNLAQVHVELGEVALAEEHLVRMLATEDASVSAARHAEAEALLARARERIGDVDVATTVPGATVLVDGEERGRTPVVLRVAAGEHRVEARLDGYQTIGVTGRVAGGQTWNVRLELVPEVAARAQLEIRPPRLEGVEVRVDGRAIGTTPLREQILSVEPGRHVVEAERAGYLPFREELTLELGESARIAPVLRMDPDAPEAERGTVRFRLPDAPATLRVDGEELRDASRAVLPVGPHAVVLEVSDRVPWREQVDVSAGEEVEITPELRWTDEALRERQSTASTAGSVGTVLMIVGGLTILAGGVVIAVSEGVWGVREDDLAEQLRACGGGLTCPPDGRPYDEIEAEREDLRLKQAFATPFAVVGLIGGAALAAAGAILRIVLVPSDEEIEREASAPALALGLGPGSVLVTGTY